MQLPSHYRKKTKNKKKKHPPQILGPALCLKLTYTRDKLRGPLVNRLLAIKQAEIIRLCLYCC